MDFFNFVVLFGGLAIFLYGMTLMGNGLERVSGGKLERILERFSNTPLKGILLGAGVTGIIQSSSATTVMVVGFVNSGIMKLSQAVGVIMGANIGTTVTAWILSLTGIEGDSFVIRFLQPKNFSLIFALIGIILIMFVKKNKSAEIGEILIGFTILILGMSLMSDSVSVLKESEKFASVLTMFSNPVLGVLAGAVVTAIIQSSSASVGILQTIAISSSLPFAVALPIILGQNIGTCVTALLACIGTSKNAKRAAMVHLYFNLIGTVLFLAVAYTLKIFIHSDIWTSQVSATTIAVIHTTFNVVTTVLFMPFTKLLEKLAVLTIRDKKGDVTGVERVGQMLDDRFLNAPAFALEQCKTAIKAMADAARVNLISSLELLDRFDPKKKAIIMENEEIIDILEDKLGSYLVKLTDKDLTFTESCYVSKYLHSINDFERVGDHAENIMEIAEEMHADESVFSDAAKNELGAMASAIRDILDLAIEVFDSNDEQKANAVEPLEEVIDLMKDTLKAKHVERLKRGNCSIESGVWFNDLLGNFERVSDHCSNLAVYVIEFYHTELKSHEYLHKLREEHKSEFENKYNEYKEKYYSPIDS